MEDILGEGLAASTQYPDPNLYVHDTVDHLGCSQPL